MNDTICLLNDSFPPQFDGVANTICNYAKELHAMGKKPIVVTPSFPGAEDSGYPYPVIRYPSVPFPPLNGYVAGIPFSPETAGRIVKNGVALMHSHCPVMSTIMARQLREIVDAPLVFTYHTKFDLEMANMTGSKLLQSQGKKALVENISACDEVWVVSSGAGENLASIGYEGEYTVMPNGVDMPKGRLEERRIRELTGGYPLREGVPTYLFVGRMMWYKGIRLILDALARLAGEQREFNMVFIGDGNDRQEIQRTAAELGIDGSCVFTGAVLDREALRAWYCRADIFLFPSTYDTNGLVVREAAAAGLPAALIEGSCASEGIVHGRNGFLTEENPDSLHALLSALYERREEVAKVGGRAADEIYISWRDAVSAATERYGIIIERYRSGVYPERRKVMDTLLRRNGEVMEALSALHGFMRRRFLDGKEQQ